MQIQTGQPYVFGPFQLSLPDAWEAEFDDGIHTILPPNEDFAIQISGYAKDSPVILDDLRDFAGNPGESVETAPVELPSGLDGITYEEEAEDYVCRFWLIRQGTAMIAVTLTAPTEDLASAGISAQMVVSSIKPSGD